MATNELAGLRAFLRSRCGTLKAAFASLDSYHVGQVTSDNFKTGLQRLGYSEDAQSIFKKIDTAGSGLLSLTDFLRNLGEDVSAEARNSRTLSPISHDWRTAQFPRQSAGGSIEEEQRRVHFRNASASISRSHSCDEVHQLAPHQVSHKHPAEGQKPVDGADGSSKSLGGALLSSTALRGSSPSLERYSLQPHQPVAGADLLYSRIARVEEQVAAEQRLRCETEQRLTQHLNSLVGVSISEQLDVLRQQLIEETMQRQVDITALRGSIESLKSTSPVAFNNKLETSIKHEVEKSILEARKTLLTTSDVPTLDAAGHTVATEQLDSLRRHVEALNTCLETRLQILEDGLPDKAADLSPTSPGKASMRLERNIQALQMHAKGLEERLESLSSKFEAQESAALEEARKAASTAADLAGQRAILGSRLEEAVSMEKVQSYMREKLDGFRIEWKGVLDEERARASERAQALGRALTEEFEKSIVSQAVAEARTEARTSVSEMESRMKDLFVGACNSEDSGEFHRAVTALNHEVEVLRTQGFGQLCTEGQGLHNRLKGLEETLKDGTISLSQSVEERLSATHLSLARVSGQVVIQAERLDTLQARIQGFSDILRTKLQALITKLDSRCVEGLAPVLEGLGNWCQAASPVSSNSRNSSRTPALQASELSGTVRTASAGEASPVGSSMNLSATMPMVPPPVHKTADETTSNSQSIVEALRQENLRLREANVEIRERFAKTQEDSLTRERLGLSASRSGLRGQARSLSPMGQSRSPIAARGPQSQAAQAAQAISSSSQGRQDPPASQTSQAISSSGCASAVRNTSNVQPTLSGVAKGDSKGSGSSQLRAGKGSLIKGHTNNVSGNALPVAGISRQDAGSVICQSRMAQAQRSPTGQVRQLHGHAVIQTPQPQLRLHSPGGIPSS
eukprot:TRINITY_DN6128_c2_g1_i2.p1 TRINITY_DN6128_c2_g1~~TRINITY_DN6128_c2_g1_i2.p1  ORF type:complete len:915 (+),score=152.72 TRINITY_DN6128_c2_g1_i2:129-2873(+)